MAYVRMSLADARARGQVDPQHVATTTEAEIRTQMLEDGFDPDQPFAGLRDIVGIEAVRVRTGLSQVDLAEVLGIPVSILQDWENGVRVGPAARALFALVADDPERAMRVLTDKRSSRRKRLSPAPAGSSA